MSLVSVLGSQATGGTNIVSNRCSLCGNYRYFLVLCNPPQKKKQKEHDSLVSSLEVGDSILTTSGFFGVVIDIMDEVVIVEFGNNKNCRIPMKKENIVEIDKQNGEE